MLFNSLAFACFLPVVLGLAPEQRPFVYFQF